jgi:hypothetical protein
VNALVSRRLSGVGRTVAWCVVIWLAAFGFPAAGLGLLEVVAGFAGVVDEVVVELVVDPDVCAHAPGVSTSQIPAAAARLSFAVDFRFIPIY